MAQKWQHNITDIKSDFYMGETPLFINKDTPKVSSKRRVKTLVLSNLDTKGDT